MDGIIDSMDSSLNKLWEVVEDRGTWFATVCGVTKSWRQLSDLTVTTTNQNRSRITNKEEKTSHTGEKKNGRRSKAGKGVKLLCTKGKSYQNVLYRIENITRALQ